MELTSLSRKDLQTLAKSHKLKSNAKSEVLIAQINALSAVQTIQTLPAESAPKTDEILIVAEIPHELAVTDLVVGDTYEFCEFDVVFTAEVLRVNKRSVRLISSDFSEKTVQTKDLHIISHHVESTVEVEEAASPVKRKRSENSEEERKRPRSNEGQAEKRVSAAMLRPVEVSEPSMVIDVPAVQPIVAVVQSPKPKSSEVPQFDQIHQRFFDTQKKITEIASAAAAASCKSNENRKANSTFLLPKDGMSKIPVLEKTVPERSLSSTSSRSSAAPQPKSWIPQAQKSSSSSSARQEPASNPVKQKKAKPIMSFLQARSNQQDQASNVRHQVAGGIRKDSVMMLKEKISANEASNNIETRPAIAISSPSTPVKLNRAAMLRQNFIKNQAAAGANK